MAFSVFLTGTLEASVQNCSVIVLTRNARPEPVLVLDIANRCVSPEIESEGPHDCLGFMDEPP